MPNTSDILWFKQQFGPKITAGITGTPFSVDMLTAIACQETGYIWQRLRKESLPLNTILELCVGDTIDAKPNGGGRSAFPKNKTELVAAKDGAAMFQIARQALVDMAAHIPEYQEVAENANKFCHGYGVFQYDLQFFLSDPPYFLQKKYADFDASLGKCLEELKRGLKKLGYEGRTSLTDLEMAYVAIAYNTGGFKPNKGLKQGYFDGKKYYGEQFFDFLRLSETVAVAGAQPSIMAAADTAIIAPPTPVADKPLKFEVDVQHDPLRLHREADKNDDDIVGRLPDGQIVQAIGDKKVNNFWEIETSLNGAYLRGFAFADYLKPVVQPAEIVVAIPVTTPPSTGLVAVYMPRKEGTITKRSQPAGAHSLNEPGQPARTGITPEELRTSLHAIIKWLAVDKPSNLRYQPTKTSTFCNVYAHDLCYLAGIYLPRVWWSGAAIEQIAAGKDVQPLYGKTIDELRANDLFRWLRDFGLRFGWRQTGTLTKLQTEVNMGAIGLIVARRKDDGRSGHIVVVVPETADTPARRASGEVVAPVQSQAGRINFQYGTGRVNWWLGDEFAESAFWLHA